MDIYTYIVNTYTHMLHVKRYHFRNFGDILAGFLQLCCASSLRINKDSAKQVCHVSAWFCLKLIICCKAYRIPILLALNQSISLDAIVCVYFCCRSWTMAWSGSPNATCGFVKRQWRRCSSWSTRPSLFVICWCFRASPALSPRSANNHHIAVHAVLLIFFLHE